MKNFVYKDNELDELLENQEIQNAKSVLIQVFCGKTKEEFEELLVFLKSKFPKAKIIATSTDGEIYKNKVLLKSCVISVSIFENVKLNSAYCDKGSAFEKGVNIAKKLVTPKTKLLIAFADGVKCNGEEFLNGISSIADVKVRGIMENLKSVM